MAKKRDSFFTPIDLPDPPIEEISAEPDILDWPTPKLFGPVIDRIAVEIDRITQGTSEFTPHGIQLDSNKGFINVWDKFRETPNKENLERFLEMAEQDVNLRAKREFKKWFDLVLEKKKK